MKRRLRWTWFISSIAGALHAGCGLPIHHDCIGSSDCFIGQCRAGMCVDSPAVDGSVSDVSDAGFVDSTSSESSMGSLQDQEAGSDGPSD